MAVSSSSSNGRSDADKTVSVRKLLMRRWDQRAAWPLLTCSWRSRVLPLDGIEFHYRAEQVPYLTHVAGRLAWLAIRIIVHHCVPAPTSDTGLFHGVQYAFGIDTLLQVFLCLFTKLEILHSDLSDKFEILFELVAGFFMVVIELHAGNTGILGWTYTERGHAAAVHVQGTVGKEIEEQTVIRLLWISNVLGEVLVIVDGIEGRWIVD